MVDSRLRLGGAFAASATQSALRLAGVVAQIGTGSKVRLAGAVATVGASVDLDARPGPGGFVVPFTDVPLIGSLSTGANQWLWRQIDTGVPLQTIDGDGPDVSYRPVPMADSYDIVWELSVSNGGQIATRQRTDTVRAWHRFRFKSGVWKAVETRRITGGP
jgi:hypothetical protein